MMATPWRRCNSPPLKIASFTLLSGIDAPLLSCFLSNLRLYMPPDGRRHSTSTRKDKQVNTHWLQALRDHLRYLGKSYLVLLLALCLTAGAWYFSRLSHTTTQFVQLGDITDNVDYALQRRIDSYINVLDGVAGLYRASISVERNEFHAYLMATELTDRLPGIKGIGFARLVPNAALDRFVAQVRNDTSLQPGGYPQFTVQALTGGQRAPDHRLHRTLRYQQRHLRPGHGA